MYAGNGYNVLWIMSDQQQAKALGVADSTYHTPNLDRLAQSGVRFTNNISASAQCTPSRAAWMTGRPPHQVGVNHIGHLLDPEEPSIGKVFKQAGYQTAYFGKWHLGSPERVHGFDIVECEVEGIDPYYADSPRNSNGYHDATTTAMALSYLACLSAEQPFFMVASSNMPHPPLETVEICLDPYTGLETQQVVPESFYKDEVSTKLAYQREIVEKSGLTEQSVYEDNIQYRTMVSYVDRQVGFLMEALRARGLDDNTIVLFTSDHGELAGAHRLNRKGIYSYNELYNAPLLLRVPGRESARKVIDDLVSSTSVAGTLIDAAGLDVPDSFTGPSLLPLLDRKQRAEEERVFFEHYLCNWGFYPFRGIQTREWKYVYYYADNEEELYDLTNDPGELVNVAGCVDNTFIKQDLRMQVDQWWKETGGTSKQPIWWEIDKWKQLYNKYAIPKLNRLEHNN